MPRPDPRDAAARRALDRAARERLSKDAIRRVAAQFVRADSRLVLQRRRGEITETEWVHASWSLHHRLVERRSEFDRARLLKEIHHLSRKHAR